MAKTTDEIIQAQDEKGEFYQFRDYPRRYYNSKIGKKLAYRKVTADMYNHYWVEELRNQSNVLVFD